jgi:uncharacterized membrane protein
VLEGFFSVFASAFSDSLPSFSLLFNVGSWIVSIVSSIFIVKIGLRLYDHPNIGSYDFLSFSSSLFFKFLLGYVLYTLLAVIGFLLLIIPGIYLAIKYQYVQYLIVDKNLDVIEAFRESGRMTDGHKWNLFLLFLLFIAISALGFLALGIGLLVTIPIVIVAQAYVYKKLCLDAVTQSDILVDNSGSAGNPFQAPGSTV